MGAADRLLENWVSTLKLQQPDLWVPENRRTAADLLLRQASLPGMILWVPRTVSRPLISAFAASRPRSNSSQAAQHDRSPWHFDSLTWRSPAC
jgi:hypothetical protein